MKYFHLFMAWFNFTMVFYFYLTGHQYIANTCSGCFNFGAALWHHYRTEE